MKVHTYCVEHDLGFAPNPFHGVCSLACCAPQLRKYASVGDVIAGRGSVRAGQPDDLVYWMLIDEIVTFDEYDANPVFADKIPDMGGSTMARFGDNMYFRDQATGEFVQRDSFHSNENGVQSPEDIKIDTGSTTNVLLGRHFTYYGGNGPKIPDDLRSMFPRRNRQSNHSPDRVKAMTDWLGITKPRGILGLPTDWATIPH